MTTSPATLVVPCAGAVATAMLVRTPLMDAERSIAVPLLPKGTETPLRAATVGAAGVATVRLIVAGADVPPGPVAV